MRTSHCGLTDNTRRSPAVPLQGLHIWVFQAWWVNPFLLGEKELFPHNWSAIKCCNGVLGVIELVSVVLYPTSAEPLWLLWRTWHGLQGAGWRRPRAVLERTGKTKLSRLEGIKPGSPGRIFLPGWVSPLIGSTCSIMPFAGEELARWQKCDARAFWEWKTCPQQELAELELSIWVPVLAAGCKPTWQGRVLCQALYPLLMPV